MAMKANLLKVKVYPKDLKAIPDILPFRDLLQGEPLELELDKKEIFRCMNFGDVFDLTTGEEVLIDRPAFDKIVEFVEEEVEETPEEGGEDEPTEEPDNDLNVEEALENAEKGMTESLVQEAKITK